MCVFATPFLIPFILLLPMLHYGLPRWYLCSHDSDCEFVAISFFPLVESSTRAAIVSFHPSLNHPPPSLPLHTPPPDIHIFIETKSIHQSINRTMPTKLLKYKTREEKTLCKPSEQKKTPKQNKNHMENARSTHDVSLTSVAFFAH